MECKCPSCGNTFDDSLPNCPVCGSEIVKSANPFAPAAQQPIQTEQADFGAAAQQPTQTEPVDSEAAAQQEAPFSASTNPADVSSVEAPPSYQYQSYSYGSGQQPQDSYQQQGYQQPNYQQQSYQQPGYQQPNYQQPNYQQTGYQQPYTVYPTAVDPNAKSKMAAGLLGIFLGALGVHNFYLGYTGKAVAQLLISLLSCGAFAPISAIWGLIEGILILTGSTITTDASGRPLSE